MLHTLGYRKSADSLDHGGQFRRHIIGKYLDPATGQFPPHRRGSAEAVVLPGFSEHLFLDSLGCTEPPENRDKETFLVDRQEVQARAGIDDRPDAHLTSLGSAVSWPPSSAAARSASSAARSTSTSGSSPGSAHAIGRSLGVTPASPNSSMRASTLIPRRVAMACAGSTPST